MMRWFGVALALCLALGRSQSSAAQGPPVPERQRMEQQLRQGMWRVAKERMSLDDVQMGKLQQATEKFDARRRMLLDDERTQRQLLRRELLAGDAASQESVADALDRLLQLHRERLDLLAEEQHELSTFMTPVQRARFVALQEQLRRRADMLRRRRAERGLPG